MLFTRSSDSKYRFSTDRCHFNQHHLFMSSSFNYGVLRQHGESKDSGPLRSAAGQLVHYKTYTYCDIRLEKIKETISLDENCDFRRKLWNATSWLSHGRLWGLYSVTNWWRYQMSKIGGKILPEGLLQRARTIRLCDRSSFWTSFDRAQLLVQDVSEPWRHMP